MVGFEQILKILINISFFAVLNNFSLCHFCSSVKTRLLTFPLAGRDNLQGCIFLREMNQTSLPTFIFCKKMYSQNYETGVLEVLQINLFCCPTMVGRPLQNFSVHFTIWEWHIYNLLENGKTKKSLNFCFYHHQVFSRP